MWNEQRVHGTFSLAHPPLRMVVAELATALYLPAQLRIRMLTVSSQEAKELEVTLQDDDPDAAEAMLRHLYSFTLKSPTFKEKLDQVRFYCNVVVASDKYGIPKLAEEAALHLQNHLVKVLVPEDVVASLKIVTEEYGGYKSLKSCVSSQVQGRMQQLASVPGFSVLLASEPRLLGELVADAMQFRTLKSINRYGCHFCGANLLSDTGRSPRCCNNTMGSRTPAYIAKFP
jgi:hypothetical protein